MKVFPILIIAGVATVIITDPIDIDNGHLQITKPANTMLPQFSWKRKNGEVIELKDEMEVNPDTGVIRDVRKTMWNALMKKRPELGREYGMDVAENHTKMDSLVKVLDQHNKKD